MTDSTLTRRPSRYPGSPPFEDQELDRRLFFGRSDDAESILHAILSHDLFVLYARSGIGKTSVLRAGVMERLRERKMWPVLVRLHDTGRSPIDLVRAALVDAAADPRIEILGIDEETTELWDLLAGLEVWRIDDDTLLLPVLIFDQFEELFTLWDGPRRQAFIEQFAGVVRRAPRGSGGDPAAPRRRVPRVKFVLSLREDFLGGLEAFSAELPQILTHRQRLQPLTRSQAEDAIREPALLDAELDSPRFVYDDRTVELILDFLGESQRAETGYSTEAEIEAFQLQILCHHIEAVVLQEKLAGVAPSSTVTSSDGDLPRITPDDIGRREGLRSILKTNYSREIENVSSIRERRKLRRLCELGLITDGRRRFVAKDEIQSDYGVTDAQLDRLVDARLLRVEPRGRTTYYELAHDSLVDPLLQYRAEQTRRARRWAAAVAAVVLAAGIAAIVLIAARSSGSGGPVVLRVGDDPVDATIADALEVDVIRIEVDEGLATLRLERLTGEAQIEVFGPESGEAGESNGDRASIGTASEAGAAVLLPEPGVYTAVVRSLGDEGAAAYALGLVRLEPIEITPDRPRVGSIGDGPERLAVYTFSAGSDQAHTVSLAPFGALDGTVQVIGSDGTVLPVVDNVGPGMRESLTVPVFGDIDFYVVVRGARGSTGNFELRLRRSTVAPIESGATATGELAVPGEVDVFTFTTGDDDVVRVNLESTGELDGVIDLIDPAGQRVARVDSAGLGDAEELTVVVGTDDAGVYLLSVEGGEDTTGEYRLALVTSSATRLERGAPRSAAIDEPGEIDSFRFVGAVGDAVSLRIAGDDVDLVVGLVDPTGERVAVVDENGDGGGETITTILTRGGTYLLEVTGYASSTGEYDVALDQSPSTSLDDEAPTGRSIDGPDSVDVYTFSGSASDAVTLTVSAGPELQAELDILDPSGRRLAGQRSTSPGAELTTTEILPETGTYIARVAGVGESSGGYRLDVAIDSVAVLTAGGEISGTIDRAGQVEVFTFSGSTDDLMTITMAPDGELNAVVELVAPTGDRIATVDSEAAGGHETLTSLLPTGGKYIVRARGFDDSVGAYTLQLRRSPAERLKLGSRREGGVEAGAVDVFEMSGVAGDVVSLTLRPDGDLDATLTVITSTGDVVAEAESGGASRDESLTVVYPDNDLYRVLVRGAAGTGGSYTLSLDHAVVTPLDVDRPHSGMIDEPGEVDVFSFVGSTDEAVAITLQPGPGLDGQLAVVDPNANELAGIDDLRDPDATETITLLLPRGGTYTVLVRGFLSTGAYTLTLEAPVIDLLEYGDRVRGTIDGPQAFDSYTFEGSQGEEPSITVVPEAGLDVVVEVIDPTGGETQVVTSGAPGETVGFTLALPEDRDYFLRVLGADDTTGTYTLTLGPPAS